MYIQVVNINRLQYTKNLISGLTKQTKQCAIRLVDQHSSEYGTEEYLKYIEHTTSIDVKRNTYNVPLNWLWNNFYKTTYSDYLCFLNNDILVPSNFVEDTINIFEKEPQVGCVVHATNHPDYCKVTDLNYKILSDKIVQGWDFTIRREAYNEIPRSLQVFGGDDYLFIEMYRSGWKTAVVLSSPIIHFNGASRKYCSSDIRISDDQYLRSRGYERLSYRSPYTIWKPSFYQIQERDKHERT